MQPTPRVAAANNAAWCDAFCRTHGVVGRFERDAWVSPQRTPPLYPDAVTLVEDADEHALLAAIDTGPGCSIKDSFARLDLEHAGFEPLLHAQWLACTGAAATDAWSAVTSERMRSLSSRPPMSSVPPSESRAWSASSWVPLTALIRRPSRA